MNELQVESRSTRLTDVEELRNVTDTLQAVNLPISLV